MNFPIPLLPAQGLGGLALALICGTLYAQRRRLPFLWWTLSWACFGLGALGLVAVSGGDPDAGATDRSWWGAAAAVCLGWHAALWLFGLHPYRLERRRAGRVDGDPHPAARPSLGVVHALVLLTVAAVAVPLGRLAAGPGGAVGSVVLAAVYGGSAGLLLYDNRGGAPGVRLLAFALALASLGQLAAAAVCLAGWQGTSLPGAAAAAGAAGGMALALLAAGLVRDFAGGERDLLHNAQRRLGEAEDHFRLVFQHGGVGMALLTPDGHFLRVNTALVEMLGYDRAELEGRRLVDFAHPDDTRHGISRSEQGLDVPPALYERERRYLHKGGHTVWARVLRVPLRDVGGALRYLVGVFIDITERRRAEEALAESERRYRLRFEGAFDGLLCCTEAGEVVEANPALCRMLGHTAEELTRLTAADLADDLPQLRRHLAAVVAQGGACCETRLRRKDGSAVDVEISGSVIESGGRRVLHLITRDVSERKRAEEALREERHFSDRVLDAAEALILVLDPSGRVVRFGGACAAVSGYREDEVRGRAFWEVLVPQAARDTVRGHFAHEVEQQAPLAFDCPLAVRTGGERWVAWRFTAVRDAHGRPRHVIGAGLDVTEQRRLEEQLRQAQKMETVGTLVGGIAHDFNNQLTIILGNLALLRADLADDARVSRELIDAEQATQRCADMTQSLLTFSRRRIPRPQLLDLNELVAETVRLLQRLLPPVVHVVARDEAGPAAVSGDRTQLHQVLMNLAVNARDAMPDGGTLTVTTARAAVDAAYCARNVEARPGNFLVLTVEDTGAGMSPEVRSRLFEPFFTTKPAGLGTGLGLAVVYGIVKAHGGWISVASTPGQGSTFRVYLPAVLAEAVRVEESAPPPVRGGHECIMVVDDEDLVRNLAQCVLERWGFRVLTAADGEQALATYRARGPEIDLVVLDFTMPLLTGLQVLRQLQRLNPAVRVIFASGHADANESEMFLAAGARAFVPKPYRPEELIRRVRQVLDDPGTPPAADAR
jgi:PAS domain S-box-containing protein